MHIELPLWYCIVASLEVSTDLVGKWLKWPLQLLTNPNR